MLANIHDWLREPLPRLVFEISEAGVTLARLGSKSRLPEDLVFRPLAAGAVESSPVKENIHDPDEVDRALDQALKQAGNGRKKQKDVALLLPDNCARIAVLDFENLPGDGAERASLIRWRLKKAVPFDVETAAISYQVQKPSRDREGASGKQLSVLVAVSPAEVIRQYEAAIRRLGLVPGYVSISVTAALNLLTEHGVTMLAKLAGRTLSLVVVNEGQVRLVRTLEAGLDPEAVAADLYPTFVYVADNFGAPVSRLALAGFGASLAQAMDVFRRELGCETAPLQGPQGPVDAHNAGIWGFLSGS